MPQHLMKRRKGCRKQQHGAACSGLWRILRRPSGRGNFRGHFIPMVPVAVRTEDVDTVALQAGLDRPAPDSRKTLAGSGTETFDGAFDCACRVVVPTELPYAANLAGLRYVHK